jgi:exopolysaccharide biosynthesis polyprenyl glycosylphosphotransferase
MLKTSVLPERISVSGRALLLTDFVCLMGPAILFNVHVVSVFFATCFAIWLFSFGDLYRPRLQAVLLDQVPSLLGRLIAAGGITALLLNFRYGKLHLEPFERAFVAGSVALLFGRAATFAVVRSGRRSGRLSHRTAIIGSGPLAVRIATSIGDGSRYGLELAGYFDQPHPPEDSLLGVTYLGDLTNLRTKLSDAGVRVVVATDGQFTSAELGAEFRSSDWNDIVVLVVPRYYQSSSQPFQCDMIGAVPLMRITPNPHHRVSMMIKRAFDVVVSALAIVVLSPLLALIALAIKAEGTGPVLFRQERVGHDGVRFQIVKFRTMTPRSDHEAATTWSIADDARVTKIGRLLRKTSLDELPQLWTILKGDMTIVGPRPERPHFAEQFAKEQENYIYRLRVPAGLTGLSQVNGLRGDTSIAERADFDNYYIENWSLWLDFKIILRTFSQVLFARGE